MGNIDVTILTLGSELWPTASNGSNLVHNPLEREFTVASRYHRCIHRTFGPD
jgi:hypothetical protein